MAEQLKQNQVWLFATEAYLPSDDDTQTTGNTLILGATRVDETASLSAPPNAEPTRPRADPDADSESAQ
jgi:hypothetical protein